MDWAAIWVIIQENFNYILVGTLILIIVAYINIKKYMKKLDKPESKPVPMPVEISLDCLDQTLEFNEVHHMEDNYYEKVKAQLLYTRDEIERKTQDYLKAKARYSEILDIERRLRFHIKNLREQESVIMVQLSKLEQQKVK